MWSGINPGSRSFCYTSADDVPLVFLHGNIGPAFYLPFLPCGNIRWYVPVQSGCIWRRRKRAFNKEHLSDCINELHTIITSLPEQQIILMGHSWGAQLALLYATKYPDNLYSCILFNPGPFTPEMKLRYVQRMQARIPDKDKATWEELRQKVKLVFQKQSRLTAAEEVSFARISSLISCAVPSAQCCYEAHLLQHGCLEAFASGADELEVFDAFSSVGKLSVPGAVLYGDADYEPIEQGELLQTRVGIQSHLIPACGHYPMIDAGAWFQDYLTSLQQTPIP